MECAIFKNKLILECDHESQAKLWGQQSQRMMKGYRGDVTHYLAMFLKCLKEDLPLANYFYCSHLAISCVTNNCSSSWGQKKYTKMKPSIDRYRLMWEQNIPLLDLTDVLEDSDRFCTFGCCVACLDALSWCLVVGGNDGSLAIVLISSASNNFWNLCRSSLVG